MIQYYRANVQVTEVSAAQININTMGQSSGENEQIWQEERWKWITASSLDQIAKCNKGYTNSTAIALFHICWQQSYQLHEEYFRKMLAGVSTSR